MIRGQKRETFFLLRATALIASIGLMLLTGCTERKNGTTLFQKDAYQHGGDYTYTVCVAEQGEYKLKLSGNDKNPAAEILVNGIVQSPQSVSLNQGVNSITVKNGETVMGLFLENGISNEEIGAYVDYISYEAEDSESNVEVPEESRTYREVASEASGKKCMKLKDTGDYISFSLEQPADALVIRYCIPDSEDGKGLTAPISLTMGEDTQKVELTSKHSWVYGKFPWNNDRATADVGGAHMFFDDVRVKLNKVYPAGTTVILKIDEDCEAAYCYLDLVEATQMKEAVPLPENALNVWDYGAVPDDGQDDAKAIYDCVQEAAKEEKEVYIPEGEYEIGNPIFPNGIVLNHDNITIRGAGMWRTVLKGESAAFAIRAGNISFYDFSVFGNVTQRRDSLDPPAFDMTKQNSKMRNIQLQNIWMEHWKVGLWSNAANGVRMAGCRIRNMFADGINLCGGTSNSVLEQNDIRYTGDDGIAMWSRGVLCENNKIVHNTIALPWLANNIALYGGKDIEVRNNLLRDTVCFGSGINLSTKFDPQVPEGTILIENNTLLRCGSYENDLKKEYGAIWINTVEGFDNAAQCIIRENRITDSAYQGIYFFNKGVISNIKIESNTIEDSRTYGIEIAPEAKGSAYFEDNQITDSKKEDIINKAQEQFTIK